MNVIPNQESGRPPGIVDDGRLLAFVKQRHEYLDVSVSPSHITERGLLSLLVVSKHHNFLQYVRMISQHFVFFRLLD